MRRLGLTEEDLEEILESPAFEDVDPDGRRRCTAMVGDLRVRVVVAVDTPDLIVTVHRRRN